MNVRNCARCGKIFNYVSGRPICAACKRGEEESFKDVRSYIRRNPDVSISEVAEACEVDIKMIRQWIREERLSFSKDSAVGIECEKCGKTIRTGRFCKECKAETINDLNNARGVNNSEPITKAPEETKKKNQMRFLNKDR